MDKNSNFYYTQYNIQYVYLIQANVLFSYPLKQETSGCLFSGGIEREH